MEITNHTKVVDILAALDEPLTKHAAVAIKETDGVAKESRP